MMEDAVPLPPSPHPLCEKKNVKQISFHGKFDFLGHLPLSSNDVRANTSKKQHNISVYLLSQNF